MRRYYISYGGGDLAGPYVESQIRGMWGTGGIRADALICEEGVEQWSPVQEAIEVWDFTAQISADREKWLYDAPSKRLLEPLPQKETTGCGAFGYGLLVALALAVTLPVLIFLRPSRTTGGSVSMPSTYEAEPDYAMGKWINISIPDPEAKVIARSKPFKTWEGGRLVAGDVCGRNAFGGWVQSRYAFVWDGEANAIGVPIDELIQDLEKGVNSTGTQEEAQGKLAMLKKLLEWKGAIILDHE